MIKIYKLGDFIIIEDSGIKQPLRPSFSTPALINGIHYLIEDVTKDKRIVGKIGTIADGTGTLFNNDLEYYDYLSTLLEVPVKYIQFAIDLPNLPHSEGLLFYDKDKHAISYYNDEADMTVNLGQELIIPIYNNTANVMANGKIVYPTGVYGNAHTVGLADAHRKEKCRLVAMLTHEVAIDSFGYATRIGSVGGLNTIGLNGVVYLSTTSPGDVTNTIPDNGSYIIAIGAVKNIDAIDGSITVDPSITELTVEVTDTSGFPPLQRANTTLAVDNGTRTFSISSVTDNFHYYCTGDKFDIYTTVSKVFDDLEGIHWFYFDKFGLQCIHQPTDLQKESIIVSQAFVAYIMWDVDNQKVSFDIFDERHGISMDPATHLYLHTTSSTKYISGTAIGDVIADDDGDLDTSAQFSISIGAIVDEDLKHIINPIAVGESITIGYLLGTNKRRSIVNPGFAVATTGTGRLAWNEWTGTEWVLSEVPENNYVLYHLFTHNGQSEQIVSVMGQSIYGTVKLARQGAILEILNILSVFSPEESVTIATFIYQTRSSYLNGVSARIRTTDEGEGYINWRETEIGQGVTPTNHNNLLGLQLAALGVNWGHIDDQTQTIYGAKTFNDDLTTLGNLNLVNGSLPNQAMTRVAIETLVADGTTHDHEIGDITLLFENSLI